MKRKDYRLIANVFAAMMGDLSCYKSPEKRSTGEAVVAVLARDMADALARDNPRFDEKRFLAACGVA